MKKLKGILSSRYISENLKDLDDKVRDLKMIMDSVGFYLESANNKLLSELQHRVNKIIKYTNIIDSISETSNTSTASFFDLNDSHQINVIQGNVNISGGMLSSAFEKSNISHYNSFLNEVVKKQSYVSELYKTISFSVTNEINTISFSTRSITPLKLSSITVNGVDIEFEQKNSYLFGETLIYLPGKLSGSFTLYFASDYAVISSSADITADNIELLYDLDVVNSESGNFNYYYHFNVENIVTFLSLSSELTIKLRKSFMPSSIYIETKDSGNVLYFAEINNTEYPILPNNQSTFKERVCSSGKLTFAIDTSKPYHLYDALGSESTLSINIDDDLLTYNISGTIPDGAYIEYTPLLKRPGLIIPASNNFNIVNNETVDLNNKNGAGHIVFVAKTEPKVDTITFKAYDYKYNELDIPQPSFNLNGRILEITSAINSATISKFVISYTPKYLNLITNELVYYNNRGGIFINRKSPLFQENLSIKIKAKTNDFNGNKALFIDNVTVFNGRNYVH